MSEGLEYSAYGVCYTGAVRESNEDNMYLNGAFIRRDKGEPQNCELETESRARSLDVFAVCDGMGGEDCGELASAIAVRQLSRLHEQFGAMEKPQPSELVRQFVSEAGAAIIAKTDELKVSRIGTTFAMVCLKGSKAFVSNVGDSRVYYYSEGRLTRLSKDHTQLQYYVDLGRITEEQGRDTSMKHGLTRFLGIRPEEGTGDAYFGRLIAPSKGDKIIICSDGLTDMLYDEELERMLSDCGDAKDTCTRLLDTSLRLGGYDNITIIALVF